MDRLGLEWWCRLGRSLSRLSLIDARVGRRPAHHEDREPAADEQERTEQLTAVPPVGEKLVHGDERSDGDERETGDEADVARAVVEHARFAALSGKGDPSHEVRGDADPHDARDDPENPYERHVEVVGLGHARAHAAEDPVFAIAVQSAAVAGRGRRRRRGRFGGSRGSGGIHATSVHVREATGHRE